MVHFSPLKHKHFNELKRSNNLDPVETRYFDNVTQIVNGLTAYALNLSITATTPIHLYSAYTGSTVNGGIRVWKRSAGGVETEITAGEPVAVASYTAAGGGTALRSAIWNCPQTVLEPTDSIVVRLYIKVGANPWELAATFTTEQLNTSLLNAATWTVYYCLYIVYDPGLRRIVEDGVIVADTSSPTRIEGFTWGEPIQVSQSLISKTLLKMITRRSFPFGFLLKSFVGLVGTSTRNTATYYPYQRKCFYANGRFWVFYSDGTNMVYSTSTDGSTWTPATTVRAAASGFQFSVWFDGQFVHYAYAWNSSIYYRRGTPNADGTITWSTSAEETVSTTYNNASNPFLTVDSNGYVWIGYRDNDGTNYYPYVIKSGNNDGTWGTTPSGFPYQLTTQSSPVWMVSVVPLTAGKVLAVYASDGLTVRVRSWTGSTWLPEVATASATYWSEFHSAVSQGDDVHLVFLKDVYYDIVYVKYSYATNSFSTERVLRAAGTSLSTPVMSIDPSTNDLYVFWAGYPTENHIYYRKYTASTGTWEATVNWISETETLTANDRITCFYQAYDDYIGLVYMTGTVYNVKFAYKRLAVKVFSQVDLVFLSRSLIKQFFGTFFNIISFIELVATSVFPYIVRTFTSRSLSSLHSVVSLLKQFLESVHKSRSLTSKILLFSSNLRTKVTRVVSSMANLIRKTFNILSFTFNNLLRVSRSLIVQTFLRATVKSILTVISSILSILKRIVDLRYIGRTLALKGVVLFYSLRSLVRRILSSLHLIRVFTEKILSSLYSIRIRILRSISSIYHLFFSLKKSIDFQYLIRSIVSKTTCSLSLILLTIRDSFSVLQGLRSKVSKFLSSIYKTLSIVKKELLTLQRIRSYVARVISMLYNMFYLTVVQNSLQFLHSLAGQVSSFLSFTFNSLKKLFNISSWAFKIIVGKTRSIPLLCKNYSLVVSRFISSYLTRSLRKAFFLLQVSIKSLVKNLVCLKHSILQLVRNSFQIVYKLYSPIRKELTLVYETVLYLIAQRSLEIVHSLSGFLKNIFRLPYNSLIKVSSTSKFLFNTLTTKTRTLFSNWYTLVKRVSILSLQQLNKQIVKRGLSAIYRVLNRIFNSLRIVYKVLELVRSSMNIIVISIIGVIKNSLVTGYSLISKYIQELLTSITRSIPMFRTTRIMPTLLIVKKKILSILKGLLRKRMT